MQILFALSAADRQGGTLFHHIFASVASYEETVPTKDPRVEEVLQAWQALATVLSQLGERPRAIPNDYFILDDREVAKGQSTTKLTKRYHVPYPEMLPDSLR